MVFNEYKDQERGSVTDTLMHYNYKEGYSSQVTKGQSCSNTCINKHFIEADDSLTLSNSIDSQYCDFILSGRGPSGRCISGFVNGYNQSRDHGGTYDCVICDFISLLGHVDADEHWLVYLHDNSTFPNSGFYSLLGRMDGIMLLYTHSGPLPGYLTVISSCMLYVCFDNFTNVEKITTQEKAQARVVFDNFKKDKLYMNCVNMTYDQYMTDIIDNMIAQQEKAIDDMGSHVLPWEQTPLVSDLRSECHDVCVDAVVPSILRNLDDNSEFGKDLISDPMFPDKEKGFINHVISEFQFIGPDRAPVEITTVEQCIEIANIIRSTGVPNYREARIPLVSGLNIKAWETYLKDYPDPLLIEYLKFGFPMSILDYDALRITSVVNHHSATQFSQAVDEYFKKELDHRTVLGPVNAIDSDMVHCSPLLTRPKDVVKRRVIVNLSHPIKNSVNEFVDAFRFDHRPFTLKLITTDDIVKEILSLNDPMLFKIDVARAFRNLRVDPVDVMKLGMTWRGQYYLSSAVVFGWKHGTASFQLVADAISYIMAQEGCKVLAYVDDFLVVAERHIAQKLYNRLSDLFIELGLPINIEKRTPPSKILTCLGISIDIENNTLSIDREKLCTIHDECLQVATKKYLTKRAFQSLLGKLIYVHKCVVPARIFINRMLVLFRENAHKKRIKLTQEFFQDLAWFLEFLPTFNGITYFKKSEALIENCVYLDASLTGLGAIWKGRVYSTPIFAIPGFHLKIVHLEMLNIVLALRTWGSYWRHKKIKIFCDNLAVVQVIRSSKTKDKFLAACIRNIWLISASKDIEVVVEHIEGRHNIIADCLSRLYSNEGANKASSLLLKQKFIWENIDIQKFNLNLTL